MRYPNSPNGLFVRSVGVSVKKKQVNVFALAPTLTLFLAALPEETTPLTEHPSPYLYEH
jgi:hypothetical protein